MKKKKKGFVRTKVGQAAEYVLDFLKDLLTEDQLDTLRSWKDDWDTLRMIPKEYGEPYHDEYNKELIGVCNQWLPILQDVHELLDVHCNPNALDDTKAGNSAMHCSALRGSSRVMNMLLLAGGNVNLRNKLRQTPLMAATEFRSPWHRAMVRLLLAEGADASAFDQAGNSALLNATYNQDLETVKVLLAHNARVERDTQFLSYQIDSPIDVAKFMIREMQRQAMLLSQSLKNDPVWRFQQLLKKHVYSPPPEWWRLEVILQFLEEADAAQRRGEHFGEVTGLGARYRGRRGASSWRARAADRLLQRCQWLYIKLQGAPRRLVPMVLGDIPDNESLSDWEKAEREREKKIKERHSEIVEKHNRKRDQKLRDQRAKVIAEKKQRALEIIRQEDASAAASRRSTAVVSTLEDPKGKYSRTPSGSWVVDSVAAAQHHKLYAQMKESLHNMEVGMADLGSEDTIYI